jgi:signal transduction histidine kinase
MIARSSLNLPPVMADNGGMSRSGWRTYLAVGAVLGTAYFLVAPAVAKLVVWPAIGLLSAAAIVTGVRLHRPSAPLAWYLFAAGLVTFVSGDTLYNVRERLLHQTPSFPSIVDLCYLVTFPLLIAGLLVLLRARKAGRDRASLIDATIIATGVGMLAWVYLIVPYVNNPELTLLQQVVAVAYPVGDLLLLAVAVRLAVGAGRRPPAWWLLAGSIVPLLAADVLFGLLQLAGTWAVGGPVDSGWILFYVCWGAAALHPSMTSLSEPAQVATRLTRSRLVLLAGASLMAPAVLVIQAIRGQPIDVAVIAGGSVVLFLLALARMGGLAGEVALQSERKRVMQTVLRATEQERLRLAADLHDGPVQELTALRYSLSRARTRVQRGQHEEAESLLAGLEVDLSTGIGGLRRLMSELRPAVLDEQGLEAALRNQARAFEAANGVSCDIHSVLEARLAPELETVLYRVTQESLTNIGKHARASRVTVSLASEQDGVRLSIHDDGVGFDPLAARELVSDGHFGLAGMRERVEMVGGRLEVDSVPGRGTTVEVRMASQPATV